MISRRRRRKKSLRKEVNFKLFDEISIEDKKKFEYLKILKGDIIILHCRMKRKSY